MVEKRVYERILAVLVFSVILAIPCNAAMNPMHESRYRTLMRINESLAKGFLAEVELRQNERWIVELDDLPIAIEDTMIEEEISAAIKRGKPDKAKLLQEEKKDILKEKRSALIDKQERVKKRIEEISKKGSSAVKARYVNTINGLAITASYDEALEISMIPGVKRVHSDGIVKAALDSSVGKISADDVWKHKDLYDENITGKNVTIAILDTGIDYRHPDLGGCSWTANINDGSCNKVIAGYDFVNHHNNPMDDHGHGTHVASIAAGNGTLKGVAPGAWLVAYKVLDWEGSGYNSDIINALERASDPDEDGNLSDHYDIVSMSLGGSGDPNDALSVATDNLVELGVVVVAAAGNEYLYQSITSPGNSRKAITVGASTDLDDIASYSSGGPTGIGTLKPDIVAPGSDICAAQFGSYQADSQCIDADHVSLSGTSMATPHVSGIVALMMQRNSSRTPDEIKYILRETAVDIAHAPYWQGMGRVDALSAVSFNGTIPIAILNSSRYEVSHTINIEGTAYSGDIMNWTLEYGDGVDPSEWSTINSSTESVDYGILGTFDTSFLEDGTGSIRLLVYDKKGLSSEDRLIINIDNNAIYYPYENDIFRRGDIFNITGSIFSSGLSNFTVLYGPGYNPGYWIDSGVTLGGDGLSVIFNSTLAEVDTSGIPDGMYQILVTVYNDDGTSYNLTDYSFFIVESNIKDGWPFRTERKFGTASVGIGELSEAPGREIVVADLLYDEYGSKIYAWYKNGTLMPGWPQNTIEDDALSPLLLDTDDDGYDEIFIPMGRFWDYEGRVYGFYPNGTTIAGWPVTLNVSARSIAATKIGGSYAIVVGDWDGGIYVLHPDGSSFPGYPWLSPAWWPSEIALNDLDGDTEAEMVFSDYSTGKLYAFNMDRSNLAGWPVDCQGDYNSRPVMGDLDNDGDMEVVFGGELDDLHAFNDDGTDYDGWPVYLGGDQGWAQISLGDIDDDDDLEIFAMHWFSIYGIEHDGSNITGWPNRPGSLYDRSIAYGDAAISDADGDGVYDIQAESSELENEYYSYRADSSNTSGWPKYLQYGDWSWVTSYNSPIFTDLDSDGMLDIVIARENYAYVFSFNATYDPRMNEWMALGNRRYDLTYLDPKRLPIAASFDGSTTIFEWEWDITDVDDPILERTGYGKIAFQGSYDMTSLDLDSYVYLEDEFIGVDASSIPELNRSAEITFYNISYLRPIIYKDGEIFAYSGYQYSSGELTIDVSGFGNYTIWASKNISIAYTGMPFPYRDIQFFAEPIDEYGSLIHSSGCNISFNGTLNGSWYSMTEGETSYTYNTSFEEICNCSYEVRCSYGLNMSGYLEIEPSPKIFADYPPGDHISDEDEVTFNCSTNHAGIVNMTLIADFSGSFQPIETVSPSGLEAGFIVDVPEGNHSWSCMGCSDYECYYADSNLSLYVDRTPPLISAMHPADQSWERALVNSFFHEVNESLLENCSMMMNISGAWGYAGASSEDTGMIELNVSLPEGSYLWNIHCTDRAGNAASNLQNRTLHIDRTKPNLTADYPPDDFYINLHNITFNWTAYDDRSMELQCNLTLNSTLSVNMTLDSGEHASIKASNLSDRQYFWHVDCSDMAGNLESSQERMAVVDTNPPTLLSFGPDNATLSSSPVMWRLTMNDLLSESVLCTVDIDGGMRSVMMNLTPNAESNSTLSGLTDGEHNWTVGCQDLAGNIFLSPVYSLFVDGTGPQIILLSPADEAVQTSSSRVLFRFNVSDAHNITNCSLSFDNETEYTVIDPVSGTEIEMEIYLANGMYGWHVSCYDGLGNPSASDEREVTVNYRPTSGGGGTSGGGSGGGFAANAMAPGIHKSWRNLVPEKEVVWDVQEGSIGLLHFTPPANTTSVTITITEPNISYPLSLSLFNISSDKPVDDLSLIFRVESGLADGWNISLLRSSGDWEEVESEYLYDFNGYSYFIAQEAGLGVFAVMRDALPLPVEATLEEDVPDERTSPIGNITGAAVSIEEEQIRTRKANIYVFPGTVLAFLIVISAIILMRRKPAITPGVLSYEEFCKKVDKKASPLYLEKEHKKDVSEFVFQMLKENPSKDRVWAAVHYFHNKGVTLATLKDNLCNESIPPELVEDYYKRL